VTLGKRAQVSGLLRSAPHPGPCFTCGGGGSATTPAQGSPHRHGPSSDRGPRLHLHHALGVVRFLSMLTCSNIFRSMFCKCCVCVDGVFSVCLVDDLLCLACLIHLGQAGRQASVWGWGVVGVISPAKLTWETSCTSGFIPSPKSASWAEKILSLTDGKGQNK